MKNEIGISYLIEVIPSAGGKQRYSLEESISAHEV